MRDEASAKADAARRLMDQPALAEAFQRLETTYVDAWRNTSPDKSEERETLYFKLTILRELRADLETTIAGSRLTEINHHSYLKR